MMQMPNMPKPKVVLITGCSDENGIGRNIATTLARDTEGKYIVYATMRDMTGKNRENAIKLIKEASKSGLPIRVKELDVTRDESVNTAVKEIIEEQGKIDVLILNAALFSPVDVNEAITPTELRANFEVNTIGNLRTTNAVVPFMRNKQQGLIITISSVLAQTPPPFSSAYNAAKAASEILALGYRYELEQFGISSVVVPLGYFPGTKACDELSPGKNHEIFEKYYNDKWKTSLKTLQAAQTPAARQQFLQSKKGKNHDIQIVCNKIKELIEKEFGKREFRTVIEPDHRLVAAREAFNKHAEELRVKTNEAYGLNFLYENPKVEYKIIPNKLAGALTEQRTHVGLFHSPSNRNNPQPKQDLEFWRNLITFKPPIDMMQKLKQDFSDSFEHYVKSIPEKFNAFAGNLCTQAASSPHWPLHDIEAGSGSLNLDNYSIKIDKMPILPNQQERCTAEQLLDYIRSHLNYFTAGKVLFEPYDDNNRKKWLSNNYIGTVMHIDFAPNTPNDFSDNLVKPRHAAVIVSDVKENSWTFSTLWSPEHLCHPISGNREFGFTKVKNGYLFYTIGADRVTHLLQMVFRNLNPETIFQNAEQLWRILQAGIVTFVNDHGGRANIPPGSTISERHNWEDIQAELSEKTTYRKCKAAL